MAEPRGRLPTPERGPIQWTELREHEHKAVVRVFLFQAKSPERISGEVPVRDLQLVDTLLIRKGAGPSENQLMPIGGKVDDGEDIDSAVRREALEETHLRPIPRTLVRLQAVQNYRFQHATEKFTKSTTKHRRAYFFAGNLLPDPHDIPYVLDPAEDKIENFERLDQTQLAQLLDAGTITTEHGPATVLDSMDRDDTRRAARGTETDQREVTELHAELLLQAGLRETEKKLEVLVQLYGGHDHVVKVGGHSADLLRSLRICRAFLYDQSLPNHVVEPDPTRFVQDCTALWQQEMDSHPNWTHGQIRRALRTVNIRDTIHDAVEHYDFERGFGVPTINFILPLLLTDKLTPSAYRVLSQNPQAKQLVEVAQVLFHYHQLHAAGDEEQKDKVARSLRRRLELGDSDDINLDTIRRWMQARDILSENFSSEYEELAEGIDRYFEVLHREAHITEFSIDQVNEVKGVHFEQLTAQAFGLDPEIATFSPDYARLVQWEAQRKLILLLMVHEATAYRREIIKRGIEPLDKLEKTLEAPGSRADQRVMRLQDHDYTVRIERRMKTLMALVRKLIVRDRMSTAVGNDTYAEALIFTDRSTPITEQIYHPTGVVTNEDNEPVSQLEVPQVVAEYLESLFASANARGDRISIEKFKGLPKPGESFHSSSAGGGAEVRMVKFYVRHTDKDGLHRMREVQMFLPQGEGDTWKSGEVDYQLKKKDDADYALRRLFSTKALRSFIELLYPAEVYGDRMQPIYSARVKNTKA